MNIGRAVESEVEIKGKLHVIWGRRNLEDTENRN